MKKPALFPLPALAAIAMLAPDASRAETFDTCRGFIASVPAVITQQGVWCMDKDLSTSIESGAAITINTNNVTIDCNDFKLGGLAAGADTATLGIYAPNVLNVTVRDCAIRGFSTGIDIEGGGGHRIEDNRLDGNTTVGISLGSGPQVNGSIIRDNVVLDTGGSSNSSEARGIQLNAPADLIDNLIDGVHPGTVTPDGSVIGFTLNHSDGTRVSGNRVRGLVTTGNGSAFGVFSFSDSAVQFRDNVIRGNGVGTAIFCLGDRHSIADNLLADFEFTLSGCTDDGGNVIR